MVDLAPTLSGAFVQVYTTEVALLNLANLAASLLYKEGSTNVDYNILGIQTMVVRSHESLCCMRQVTEHLLILVCGSQPRRRLLKVQLNQEPQTE